jgi:hypothetical protein
MAARLLGANTVLDYPVYRLEGDRSHLSYLEVNISHKLPFTFNLDYPLRPFRT